MELIIWLLSAWAIGFTIVVVRFFRIRKRRRERMKDLLESIEIAGRRSGK